MRFFVLALLIPGCMVAVESESELVEEPEETVGQYGGSGVLPVPASECERSTKIVIHGRYNRSVRVPVFCNLGLEIDKGYPVEVVR